jgi:hypothetical protein
MTQILAQFDVKEFISRQYHKTVRDLEAAGMGHPQGRLYQIAVQERKGLIVTVEWESEKELDEFSKTIVPVLEKNGVMNVKPALLPVYNIGH